MFARICWGRGACGLMGGDGTGCAPDTAGRGSLWRTRRANAPFMSDGRKYGTGGICISSLSFCSSAWMAGEGESLKPFPDGRDWRLLGQIAPSQECVPPPSPRAAATEAPQVCIISPTSLAFKAAQFPVALSPPPACSGPQCSHPHTGRWTSFKLPLRPIGRPAFVRQRRTWALGLLGSPPLSAPPPSYSALLQHNQQTGTRPLHCWLRKSQTQRQGLGR